MPPSGHRKTEKQQQADLHRLQVKVDPGVPGEILSKESQAVSEEQHCLPAGCFSVGAGSLRPPRRKWLRTQHPLPGTSTPPPVLGRGEPRAQGSMVKFSAPPEAPRLPPPPEFLICTETPCLCQYRLM